MAKGNIILFNYYLCYVGTDSFFYLRIKWLIIIRHLMTLRCELAF